MEDGRTTVTPWGVHSIDLENVKMWVETEVTVGALDDGDGAALAVCNAPIRLTLAIVGRYGVGEDA